MNSGRRCHRPSIGAIQTLKNFNFLVISPAFTFISEEFNVLIFKISINQLEEIDEFRKTLVGRGTKMVEKYYISR